MLLILQVLSDDDRCNLFGAFWGDLQLLLQVVLDRCYNRTPATRTALVHIQASFSKLSFCYRLRAALYGLGSSCFVG
jgi:hypothetical protein